jgi:hypothetical protein
MGDDRTPDRGTETASGARRSASSSKLAWGSAPRDDIVVELHQGSGKGALGGIVNQHATVPPASSGSSVRHEFHLPLHMFSALRPALSLRPTSKFGAGAAMAIGLPQ